MRAFWKGYLKLALVSCPIGLHRQEMQRPVDLPAVRLKKSSTSQGCMGPNLESCALTRGNLRVLGGSNVLRL